MNVHLCELVLTQPSRDINDWYGEIKREHTESDYTFTRILKSHLMKIGKPIDPHQSPTRFIIMNVQSHAIQMNVKNIITSKKKIVESQMVQNLGVHEFMNQKLVQITSEKNPIF